ncbi:MAG: hypothetical protein IKN63_02135 [Bacilli bacterium]|nr:hypothetical protein [Bacilli bacterium]
MKNMLNKIKGISKRNKIIIIIGIVLVVIIGISIFFIIRNNNKGNKLILDDDKPIVENIKVDNTINEISVVSSRIEKLGKVSSIYVKVKNNTDSIIDKSDLKLTIKDSNDNVILTSYIKEFNNFNIGEEREFQVSTSSDISNASKYIVEKVVE